MIIKGMSPDRDTKYYRQRMAVLMGSLPSRRDEMVEEVGVELSELTNPMSEELVGFFRKRGISRYCCRMSLMNPKRIPAKTRQKEPTVTPSARLKMDRRSIKGLKTYTVDPTQMMGIVGPTKISTGKASGLGRVISPLDSLINQQHSSSGAGDIDVDQLTLDIEGDDGKEDEGKEDEGEDKDDTYGDSVVPSMKAGTARVGLKPIGQGTKGDGIYINNMGGGNRYRCV